MRQRNRRTTCLETSLLKNRRYYFQRWHDRGTSHHIREMSLNGIDKPERYMIGERISLSGQLQPSCFHHGISIIHQTLGLVPGDFSQISAGCGTKLIKKNSSAAKPKKEIGRASCRERV